MKWSRYELGLLWTLILTVTLIIAGLKQPYVTQIWNIINKYVYNGSNKLLAPINWDVNDEGSKLKLLTDRIKSMGEVTMAIFTSSIWIMTVWFFGFLCVCMDGRFDNIYNIWYYKSTAVWRQFHALSMSVSSWCPTHGKSKSKTCLGRRHHHI